MARPGVKTRFRAGTIFILLLFCVGASFSAYRYLRKEAVASVYRDTELFIAMAEASRNYVKDVLRPVMQERLPEGDFLLEAMSTSFVSRQILNRVHDHFPEFEYKRAAANPRNPVNLASEFEADRIAWFANNPSTTEWSGLVDTPAGARFVRMTPVVVDASCLSCHGRPEDAPEAIRKRYGTTHSYGYAKGEVIAAETLYIPFDRILVTVKEKAWWIFLIATLTLFSLLALFSLLFQQTAVSELRGLLHLFARILHEDPTRIAPVGDGSRSPEDEVALLKAAITKVATELALAHRNLITSEAKYREIFAASPDAILICEGDHLTDINRAGIELFGFESLAEATAIESVYPLFWDGRDAAALFDTLQKTGLVRDHEISIVNRQGLRRDAMVSAILHREDGTLPTGKFVVRDITDRKRLLKTMAQTDKLASIGQLAAGVAHEINNPLGVIELYGELVADGVSDRPEVLDDLEIIRKHARICKGVVSALLDFSRAGIPDRKATDLHPLIEEILAVLAKQFRDSAIGIETDFDAALPPIVMDARQIRQVLMNLLLNAVQAMDETGRVRVATRLQPEKETVTLSVMDTGSGIPEKNLERIFEPFFTTKEEQKGTGLGLAVVYGIITRHGGRIDVESRSGHGTTFTITLPLEPKG